MSGSCTRFLETGLPVGNDCGIPGRNLMAQQHDEASHNSTARLRHALSRSMRQSPSARASSPQKSCLGDRYRELLNEEEYREVDSRSSP